ncbi:MAG: flagellar export chaperone FlgN [Deltaproteobacteria bacterium]|nr:flagellar export chaperone FlgN [Deltaproteobacteria bacterium]
MEKDINRLKNLYLKRVSLYEELLGCIKRESDNLINQDIKGIWSSLDEKKEILEAIEENNRSFPENYTTSPVPADISRNDKDSIMSFKKKLMNLKQEIGTRINENISFINDTLTFINDVFNTITNTDKKPDIYGRDLKKRNGTSNLIYHNEV